MAREDEHQLKAQRNEDFAASLDLRNPIHENWAVVATFYSALHYVESYFARYSVSCGSHFDRSEKIKGDVKLRAAYGSYAYLYTLSLTARYKCVGLPDNPYTKEAIPRLVAVKQQIQHALK